MGPARRRRWLPKLCIVAADSCAVALVMLAAFLLRDLVPGSELSGGRPRHVLVGAMSLPLWVGVFARYRLYSARNVASRLHEFRSLIHAVAVSVLLTAGLSLVLGLYVSRRWLFVTCVLGLVVLPAERNLAREVFRALRRRGRLLRPVVIVGGNVEGLALAALLDRHRALGYRVVGFVDNAAAPGQVLGGHPVLGTLEDTLAVVRRVDANGVIIATTAVDTATSNRLARQLTDAGLHVELSSTLRDIAAERLTVRPLDTYPMVYVEPVRRSGWRAAAKWAFDVVVAAAALAVLAPLLVIVAAAIKLDSPGPVLFRQKRVGRDGRLFEVVKFRTMVANAEALLSGLRENNEADGPLFKIRDDPRVTRVGRVLRRLSLDELPQLANVVRGEMSLVGPRPALPDEVLHWAPELHQRLRVKPGLTGMWQVSGRSNLAFEDYMRLDLYYVDNWSLWTDLAILAKTFPTVLVRRGAY